MDIGRQWQPRLLRWCVSHQIKEFRVYFLTNLQQQFRLLTVTIYRCAFRTISVAASPNVLLILVPIVGVSQINHFAVTQPTIMNAGPSQLKGPFNSTGFPLGCNSSCDANLSGNPGEHWDSSFRRFVVDNSYTPLSQQTRLTAPLGISALRRRAQHLGCSSTPTSRVTVPRHTRLHSTVLAHHRFAHRARKLTTRSLSAHKLFGFQGVGPH